MMMIIYESLFLYTRNLIPGVKSFLHQDDDVVFSVQDDDEVGGTVEYRQWDPFKSRLAAAILSGDAQNILWIEPGSRVLVIYSRDDAHFGITISHISDIVGPKGMVYVVEPSESNRDSLLYMADKRSNIVPIAHSYSAWHYRMLINFVDVLFAAPDRRLEVEVRMTFLNAIHFLKTGGHYVLYVQGNCIESTNRGDPIFNSLTKADRVQFQRMKQVTLEPFDSDHEYVSGVFRTLEIDKVDQSCLVSTKFPIQDSPSYVHTEKYINRFDEFFEIVGCLPFKSSDEALIYLTADNNNRLPKKLLKFLEQHLPPGMVDGEHCYSLALINMGIGREIVHTAKISCSSNSSYVDIFRGVRMNIEKIFKNMKPGDLEKAQRDLARMFIRQKFDSPDKGKLPKRTKKRRFSG
ncbi:rRNA 2'-O-methyltransferase fibrillarin [Trifolium repens]|nr:rRNA 2'-O-methyltransferase fibrillarin [Trifolium repens]